MMINRILVVTILLWGLSACGGNKNINYSCDEPQRYQQVTDGKRIQPPSGLDPLDEFAEMPIPKAEGAPVRPVGARCIELPPAVRAGG